MKIKLRKKTINKLFNNEFFEKLYSRCNRVERNENTIRHFLDFKWEFVLTNPNSSNYNISNDEKIVNQLYNQLLNEIDTFRKGNTINLVEFSNTGVTIDPITFVPVLKFYIDYNP